MTGTRLRPSESSAALPKCSVCSAQTIDTIRKCAQCGEDVHEICAYAGGLCRKCFKSVEAVAAEETKKAARLQREAERKKVHENLVESSSRKGPKRKVIPDAGDSEDDVRTEPLSADDAAVVGDPDHPNDRNSEDRAEKKKEKRCNDKGERFTTVIWIFYLGSATLLFSSVYY